MTRRGATGGGGVALGGVPSGGTANAILYLNSSGALSSSSSLKFGPTAGQGVTLAAGTATTDVKALDITQTWNSGGTTFTAAIINVTDTASSSNSKLLRLLVGSASRVEIYKNGNIYATDAYDAMAATAIPAGGTTGKGYRFFSTANFGVFGGSGAPTLSAAKGSLYLRSDGSGVSDRAYINTDGGTTWTAITTAA